MPSLTIENYLKAIYQISAGETNTPASTGQLAEALHLAPGTVTSMLKSLHESGLVKYTPYEGVRLTENGRKIALRVLRRHRLIELFLVKTLQLSWDQVHEEAENMEHAMSDWLIDHIDQYLDCPQFDPHGDPIPQADGTVPTSDGRSLAEWNLDEPFQLVRVMNQSPEFLRFLGHQGLKPGAVGRVIARGEEGELQLQVGDQQTHLEPHAAQELRVIAVEQVPSSSA